MTTARLAAIVKTDTAQATALLIQAARAGRPGAGAMLNLLPDTD